jgi:hypothetical protein
MRWAKRDPKEIAQAVRRKVEQWERTERGATRGEGEGEQTGRPFGGLLPDLAADLAAVPPWDRPPDFSSLTPDRLTDLLLAGWMMADWLLEERELDGQTAGRPAGRPGWCLLCGRRGPDMRQAGFHATGCAVRMWIRGAGGGGEYQAAF